MAAIGFKPIRYMNGTAWNGAVVRHSVLSGVAILTIGDLVDLGGTASISPTDGAILHDVIVPTATSFQYGVITAFIPALGGTQVPNLNITYGPTGVYRECWVAPLEPTLVLACTANSALTTAALGLTYDPVLTAGSTVTGASANVLSAAPATAGAGAFLFYGILNEPNNLGTLVSGITIAASTANISTIIEVICVKPRIGVNTVTLGV